MDTQNPYDQRYAGDSYYWGKKPSSMCNRLIELVQPSPDFRPSLLDLGCGEGRNAVHFAAHGFEVVALDTSQPGLEKTRRYADERDVEVKTVLADIGSYEIDREYDVIFSTATLQYLPPEVRAERFEHFRQATTATGFNVHSAFVRKPFIAKAPDGESTAHPYRSGELMGYFWDWEILWCTENIFDCNSSGVPHKHAIDRIITRRYQAAPDANTIRLE